MCMRKVELRMNEQMKYEVIKELVYQISNEKSSISENLIKKM